MKIKITKTDVLSPIRERWSPRAFSDESLTDAELESLFEAALCAPSAFNEQPWRYFYTHRNSPEFQQVIATLAPSNRAWAQRAAVLVISCVTEHLTDGRANPYALHDLGAANLALLLQATSKKIYGHPIGGLYTHDSKLNTHYDSVGFDVAKLKLACVIPETYSPTVIIAMGRLGSPNLLDEPYRSYERKQYPVSKIAEFVRKL